MKSPHSESGFDELMRLSRQTAHEAKEMDQKEQQRTAKRQVVQGVLKGLREINVSVAVGQLKSVATPEIIKAVSSLAQKQGTDDLRKLISGLANDLEKRVGKVSASNPELLPLERSIKTLVILIELFFSIR